MCYLLLIAERTIVCVYDVSDNLCSSLLIRVFSNRLETGSKTQCITIFLLGNHLLLCYYVGDPYIIPHHINSSTLTMLQCCSFNHMFDI